MIEVRFRPFVAENVLEMIGPKRSAILPLGVAGAIAFSNCDPAMPANRLSLSVICLFEPRNHKRRFRLKLAVGYVVIGQGAIKWVLPRNESHRNITSTLRSIGIIKTTIIRSPI